MLGNKDALATLAVKDLAAARSFYERTLGLRVVHVEGGEAITFQSGSTRVLVYRSQFAGTNRATAVNFMVGADLEAVVKGLKDRGVAFEHYDLPGATMQGDVHVFSDLKTAWFKDPDGNVISLMNR